MARPSEEHWAEVAEAPRNWRAGKVLDFLRGQFDSMVTKGSPLEALVRSTVAPEYESQGIGPYSAQTPEEWGQVAQGYAGAGPTRLERAVLSGEVTKPTGSRWADALRKEATNPALERFPKAEVERVLLQPRGKAARVSPFAGLKRRLREEMRWPEEDAAPVVYKGEPMTREQLRARTDRAVVLNAARNPENRVTLAFSPAGGSEYGSAAFTEFQPGAPITVNLAKSGGTAKRQYRGDVTGKPLEAAEALIPDITDWFQRRGSLAHELGERQVIEGERPAVGFATHAGPSARLNEFAVTGARSPVALEATLRSIRDNVKSGWFPPSEGELLKRWIQYGGTASRPLPNDPKIAKRLARRLRIGSVNNPDFAGSPFDVEEILQNMRAGIYPPRATP